MFTFRKTLVVALFVLLSAVLFTVLLPLVFNTLMAFYGYQAAIRTQGKFSAKDIDKSPAVPPGYTLDTPTGPSNQPEPQIDFQPVAPDPTSTPLRPFGVAENFFMTSWVSITTGLSLSVTAAIFLAIGGITQRFRPAIRDGR
jgi:hypothetical protein